MFQEKCKKSTSDHLKEFHTINDPCCFEKLIFLEQFYESKNLSKNFSDYFFKLIKKYYKENLHSLKNLTQNSELILLNMLIKYSSAFYFVNKISYSKFLTKVAFKIHNFNEDVPQELNFKNKFFPIFNNLACFYYRYK